MVCVLFFFFCFFFSFLFVLVFFLPAAAAAAAVSNPALNVAALLASGTQVTPQIAMAAQMAALQAKTLAETGIAVPSYYNPSAVNPTKFAEQEKKRKMLWQGKKDGVRAGLFIYLFIFFFFNFWKDAIFIMFSFDFVLGVLFFSFLRRSPKQPSCGRSLTLETRTKMLNFANWWVLK